MDERDDGIVVDMWFVYVLRCSDNFLYIGETNDVSQRLAKHNESGCRFTAGRRPVQLALSEEHPNRDSALPRERQLNGLHRFEYSG